MINVILRCCGYETVDFPKERIDHRPEWFSKENCYKSLIISLVEAKEHIEKFIVVYDGPKGSYYQMIMDSFSGLQEVGILTDVFDISYNDYAGSLEYATKLGLDLNSDIYLVEDDYLHQKDAITKIVQALPKYGVLTGYDHPHRYTGDDDMKYDIKVDFNFESQSYWRTAESTCHTYAITKDLFHRLREVFLLPEYIKADRILWRYLHTIGVPLWNSIPGLSTQVDPYMAPGVDWKECNDAASRLTFKRI